MARVKFSPIISKVEGSVGSATFQNCRGGAILRNKPIPRNSWTNDQYWAKYYVSKIQYAWSQLTVSQQASWSSFLSFVPQMEKKNSKILLSGFSLFLKYNLIRQHIGLAIITSFDYTPLDAYDLTPSLNFQGGVLHVTFQQNFSDDAGVILFKLSPPLKSPSPAQKGKLRKIWLSDFAAPGELDFNIFLTYYERFGVTAQVGDTVLAGVTLISAVAPIIQAEQYFSCTMI